jgi:hypothetical protein
VPYEHGNLTAGHKKRASSKWSGGYVLSVLSLDKVASAKCFCHAIVGDHFYIRDTTVEYAIFVELYEAMDEVGKTQCSSSLVDIYYSRTAFLISVPF